MSSAAGARRRGAVLAGLAGLAGGWGAAGAAPAGSSAAWNSPGGGGRPRPPPDGARAAERPPPPAELERLPSGGRVERVEAGTGGGRAAQAGDGVQFHYVLRRPNGYFVFSTEDAYVGGNDADGEPVNARLGTGELLPGIEEALLGQRPGADFRVLVPPEAGYQAFPEGLPQVQGFGPRRQVESNKQNPLVFEVRLLKVSPPPGQ